MSDELLKRFPKSKGALILNGLFNHCILRFENGVFIYSAECIITQLTTETKEAIESGALDLYADLDLDESSQTYAIEHFHQNIEGSLGPNYPVYEYENEEEV